MDTQDSYGFTRLGDFLGDALPPSFSSEGRVDCSGRPDLSSGRLLTLAWPEVVGAEVAANARPVQLRQNRLVVTTSSSVWAQTLQFMSATIITALNERLGEDAVTQIVFRHAGWEQHQSGTSAGGGDTAHDAPVPSIPVTAGDVPAARSPGEVYGTSRPSRRSAESSSTGPASTLSEEQKGALAAVERLDLDPKLRDRMVRAMKASFVRGEQDFVR